MIMMKKILTAHKIAKIKGAKISLWTNSPKLRAAKIKGFTVVALKHSQKRNRKTLQELRLLLYLQC